MDLYRKSRLLEICAKLRARFGHAISRVDLSLLEDLQKSSSRFNIKSATISWQSHVKLSAASDLIHNTRDIKNIYNVVTHVL